MIDELNISGAAKKAEKKPEPKAAAEWPKFMKSLTRFQYTDPVTNIRFAPDVPVRIDAEPKEGSWLHSQMEAGFIGGA